MIGSVSSEKAGRDTESLLFSVCLFVLARVWSGVGPAAGPGPGKMEQNYFPVKVVELPRKIEI